MLSVLDLGRLQRDQYAHDMRNHFDIVSLHKLDRLKHYGLHFAKYVGRLARDNEEPKSIESTFVDAFLVSLSAANTLHQDLGREKFEFGQAQKQLDPLRTFADAAGRFADACEKIDHLEDFLTLAKKANRDVTSWVIEQAQERQIDLDSLVQVRRQQLAERQFFPRPDLQEADS